MRAKYWVLAVALAGGLSACGTTDLERGTSGALIGAGAAVATDNDPVIGAAIGAGAGVFCDNAGVCR